MAGADSCRCSRDECALGVVPCRRRRDQPSRADPLVARPYWHHNAALNGFAFPAGLLIKESPFPAVTAPSTDFATSLADRYVVERKLGAGAMATVYLARDVRHDRPVAIKVLGGDVLMDMQRFHREIRVL